MAALLLSMLRASVLTEVSQLQKWVPKVPFGTPALRAVHSDDWRYDLSWGFMLHSVSMATLALWVAPQGRLGYYRAPIWELLRLFAGYTRKSLLLWLKKMWKSHLRTKNSWRKKNLKEYPSVKNLYYTLLIIKGKKRERRKKMARKHFKMLT